VLTSFCFYYLLWLVQVMRSFFTNLASLDMNQNNKKKKSVGFGDIAPVTSQGRLIVSAAILAGIAIIPAQAAKLVDIFIETGKQLEQQGKVKRRQPRSGSGASSKSLASSRGSATDGKGPTGASIDVSELVENAASGSSTVIGIDAEDTTRTCSQCGTSSHRFEASFCWSCGSEL